ncbi:hypothetical protein EDD11_002288 [Mortierella claussenii]|nr:hypothetical protein EDD11_002288 [Mortierella claussenii]
MDSPEIGPGDFVLKSDREIVVFTAVVGSGAAPAKVRCPECQDAMDPRSASRHYRRRHVEVIPVSGESSSQPVLSKRKRGESEDRDQDDDSDRSVTDSDGSDAVTTRSLLATQQILNEVSGGLPLNLLEPFLSNLGAHPYRVTLKNEESNFSILASESAATRLSSGLRPGCTLQKIRLSDSHLVPSLSKDFSQGYDKLSEDHLRPIEMGGVVGLERLVGAILKTGESWFEIHCLEVYGRDCMQDPHAEPPTICPSSVPNTAMTTQYCGRLKVTVLSDSYGNPRLVIGVRDFNYLVTAGNYKDTVIVGPSRCGAVFTNEKTQVYIKKERQDPHALSTSIFGLAQVRSKFGHPSSYTTRRAALCGYSALSQIPVTVFTLSLWGLEQASIFYRLWQRSKEPGPGPVLRIEDLDSRNENNTRPGQLLRTLRELFANKDTLNVSSSTEAEECLSALASCFSKQLSDKNRIVMKNNISND